MDATTEQQPEREAPGRVLTRGMWVLKLWHGFSLQKITTVGPRYAYFQIPGLHYRERQRGHKRERTIRPWEIEITPWQALAFAVARHRLFVSLGMPGLQDSRWPEYQRSIERVVFEMFGRKRYALGVM